MGEHLHQRICVPQTICSSRMSKNTRGVGTGKSRVDRSMPDIPLIRKTVSSVQDVRSTTWLGRSLSEYTIRSDMFVSFLFWMI